MERMNPCKNCICLPTCVTKYKELRPKLFYPVQVLAHSCDILFDVYCNDHDNIDDILDKWWNKNYG